MIDSPLAPPERGVSLPTRVVVSLRAGVVLALAKVLCIIIFSWAWVHVRAEPKTISVTGSARKAIDSDLIVWSCAVRAYDPKQEVAYAALKASTDKVLAFLNARAIPQSEVVVGSINTHQRYKHDGQGHETEEIAYYELELGIEVTSSDVGKIADAARNVTDLIKDGVYLESRPPQFLYTKLADLKITMLADATKDATARAVQIASNSGAKLGSIQDAKMGVMQINALHSTDVSGSGVNDTSSRQKEITAVVTARFGLQ